MFESGCEKTFRPFLIDLINFLDNLSCYHPSVNSLILSCIIFRQKFFFKCNIGLRLIKVQKNKIYFHVFYNNFSFKIKEKYVEAGATFDNSFFDNCFIFLRQFKNRSFLGVIFLPVTARRKN